MRDLYAVILTALSMFIGMGLYSAVATFVVTRKRFILWAYRKGLKVGAELEDELEDFLK